MKKMLSTALLLTLSVGVLITPVSANEVRDQVEHNNVLSVQQEINHDVLEGRIKEVTEFNLIVEDLGGKAYIVPIMGFKELEEYQSANIQVGQKISIKGSDLTKEGTIKIAMYSEAPKDIKLDGNGLYSTVEIFNKEARLISESLQKEFKGDEDKAIFVHSNQDMEGKLLGKVKIAKALKKEDQILDAVQLNYEEITMIDGTASIGNVVAANKEGQIPDAVQLNYEEITMIEGAASIGNVVVANKVEGNVFLPLEITIENITMKPKMMKAVSATRLVK